MCLTNLQVGHSFLLSYITPPTSSLTVSQKNPGAYRSNPPHCWIHCRHTVSYITQGLDPPKGEQAEFLNRLFNTKRIITHDTLTLSGNTPWRRNTDTPTHSRNKPNVLRLGQRASALEVVTTKSKHWSLNYKSLENL